MTISIQVVDEAPSITYPDSPFTFTKNTPVTGVLPTNVGGLSSDWTIDTGSLPSGLSLDFLTGEISGTPDTVTPNAPVTINATNAGGYGTTIQIEVIDEAPSITYPGSPYTLTKDTPVSGIVPENTGGVVEEWNIIVGTLPDGLNFDDTNGEITGTPVDVTTSTIVVTIRANNTAGESLVTVQIDVQDQVPEIDYVPDDVTLLNASSIVRDGAEYNWWSN